MTDDIVVERRGCTECGGRVRVLTPQLCDACLNGPVAPAPEIKAVQCCCCREWSTQTILRADPWDSAAKRAWCQPCIERAAREAQVYANALRGAGLR